MTAVMSREVVTPDRPIPEPRWRGIIRDVCAEYKVHPRDVIRRGRGPNRFLRPRIEIVRRLVAIGYSQAHAAKIVLRDHSTISWHLGRKRTERPPVNA